MSDQDSFWANGPGSPGEASDVRNGRYHLADPVTGRPATWRRASNVGAPLVDRFGLEIWRTRQLLRGLGERADLLDLLRSMLDYDNAKLDEIAESALHVAATSESANVGTAIHEIHLRVDRGEPVPEGMERYADGYRAALDRAGLTAVAREARVINRALGIAGRLDGVYREVDGTFVVGDTKTGNVQRAIGEIGPQLAAYATADWIELPDTGWSPLGAVRTDYAIIFDTDRETGAVTVYRVDLYLGAYGANLAEQVREYRTMDRAMLAPYVRPTSGRQTSPGWVLPAPAAPPALDTPTAPVVDQDASTSTGGRHLQAVPAPTADPWAVAETSEQERATDRATDGVTIRQAADALARMTKAQVQTYARSVDPDGVGKDLAHTKAVLIRMLGDRGKVLGWQGQEAHPAPTATPRGNDPAAISAGPIGSGEDPTDPRSPAFIESVSRRIGAATTVAELSAVHAYVVRVGGDQAWTPGMTGLARARAEQLDREAAERGDDQFSAIMARIAQCSSQADLAALWTEVTVGGSRPEMWASGGPVDTAARERMRQIESARPDMPANPFGGA